MTGNFRSVEETQAMFGFGPIFLILVVGILILDVYLRGKALWRSSRNSQTGWFVALLIINSIGILPTIYLLTNSEKKAIKSK